MTLITVQEAALVTHRAPSTIYSWIQTGDLTPVASMTGILVDGREAVRVASRKRRGRPDTPKPARPTNLENL